MLFQCCELQDGRVSIDAPNHPTIFMYASMRQTGDDLENEDCLENKDDHKNEELVLH